VIFSIVVPYFCPYGEVLTRQKDNCKVNEGEYNLTRKGASNMQEEKVQKLSHIVSSYCLLFQINSAIVNYHIVKYLGKIDRKMGFF
jgi:hypothetical protein